MKEPKVYYTIPVDHGVVCLKCGQPVILKRSRLRTYWTPEGIRGIQFGTRTSILSYTRHKCGPLKGKWMPDRTPDTGESGQTYEMEIESLAKETKQE